ncbi:alpha/beta-hydrolase [Thozetella sp. PMI_491]|nr:alpha/beta-hydrolase [Thozetella sp. PMI_491]
MTTENTIPATADGGDVIPTLPLATRIKYAVLVYTLKILLLHPILAIRSLHRSLFPPAIRADIVKTYSCRKGLPIRIFFPKSYDRSSGQKLPTLFTIHGGGYVLGEPVDNEEWNAAFASKHSFLVVALNYNKAPGSPFPAPIHDVEALFLAAMEDPALPIDDTRVAMAGWSAGGNLTLTVSQLESVCSRVHAIVPLYPLTDLSVTLATKLASRRFKPALGGFRGRDSDFLARAAPIFNWAYLPAGHDSHDPLMSPYYALRSTLPKSVFVIGCELDMLAPEAWRMACKLGGRTEPKVNVAVGKDEPVGKGELVLDDERYAFEERVDGGRYRWLLVPDTIHGFDQSIEGIARDDVLIADAKIKIEKTIAIIGEWLLEAF